VKLNDTTMKSDEKMEKASVTVDSSHAASPSPPPSPSPSPDVNDASSAAASLPPSSNPTPSSPSSVSHCAICLESPCIDEASLDSCSHKFCFSCILKWTTQISSTCPLCKAEVKYIKHRGKSATSKTDGSAEGDEESGEDGVQEGKQAEQKDEEQTAAASASSSAPSSPYIIVPVAPRLQSVSWQNALDMEAELASLPSFIRDARCTLCGSDANEELLLLCDGCDGAWHTFCVGLDGVPEGDFFCPRCQEEELQGGARGRGRRRRRSTSRSRLDADVEELSDENAEGASRPKRRRLRRAGEVEQARTAASAGTTWSRTPWLAASSSTSTESGTAGLSQQRRQLRPRLSMLERMQVRSPDDESFGWNARRELDEFIEKRRKKRRIQRERKAEERRAEERKQSAAAAQSVSSLFRPAFSPPSSVSSSSSITALARLANSQSSSSLHKHNHVAQLQRIMWEKRERERLGLPPLDESPSRPTPSSSAAPTASSALLRRRVTKRPDAPVEMRAPSDDSSFTPSLMTHLSPSPSLKNAPPASLTRPPTMTTAYASTPPLAPSSLSCIKSPPLTASRTLISPLSSHLSTAASTSDRAPFAASSTWVAPSPSVGGFGSWSRLGPTPSPPTLPHSSATVRLASAAPSVSSVLASKQAPVTNQPHSSTSTRPLSSIAPSSAGPHGVTVAAASAAASVRSPPSTAPIPPSQLSTLTPPASSPVASPATIDLSTPVSSPVSAAHPDLPSIVSFEDFVASGVGANEERKDREGRKHRHKHHRDNHCHGHSRDRHHAHHRHEQQHKEPGGIVSAGHEREERHKHRHERDKHHRHHGSNHPLRHRQHHEEGKQHEVPTPGNLPS